MSKALEAAVNEPRGNYLTREDWMRGCILKFLDAAAGDERLGLAFAIETHRGCDFGMDGYSAYEARKEYWDDMGKAAILALKEAVG